MKKKKVLFYEYDSSLKQYITTERIDCFLVPILPYAMIQAKKLTGEDEISIVSEVPVSKKLYTQLVNFYLPILEKNISYYGKVKLDIEVNDETLPNAGAVGTGVSGGIDSSYTMGISLS